MTQRRPPGVSLAVCLTAALCGVSARGQTVVYVDADATGPTHDGSTWCQAYQTLHEALDAVSSGTIKVADGKYLPNPSGLDDPREATFQLTNGVTVLGGFAGCGAPDPDAQDTALYETILSGDFEGDDECIAPGTSNCCSVDTGRLGCDDPECQSTVCSHTDDEGREYSYCCMSEFMGWDEDCVTKAGELCDCVCLDGDNLDNSYHVVTASGVDATAVLDGFTISGGNADHIWVEWPPITTRDGGGLYAAWGSPTLINCTFTGNTAADAGGAVYFQGSSSTLEYCKFDANIAFNDNPEIHEMGGGVYALDSNLTLTGCVFEDNHAGNALLGYGGGLYSENSTLDLSDGCTFTGNSAGYAGGGLHGNGNPLTLLDGCTFTGNTAGNIGGGMYNAGLVPPADPSTVTLTSCVFTSNESPSWGAGLALEDYTVAILLDACTFESNESAGGKGGGLWLAGHSEATLTGCDFTANKSTYGGGVGVFGYSEASFTQCDFENNEALSGGGGISVESSSEIVVSGCTLDGNMAVPSNGYYGYGGGIHSSGSVTTIQDYKGTPTVIRNCETGSQGSGGAVYSTGPQLYGYLVVRNCLIESNYAGFGAGVYADLNSEMVIEDATIQNNGVSSSTPPVIAIEGGGVLCGGWYGNEVRITRCDILNNKADCGGGVFIYQNDVLIEDSTIAGNEAQVGGGIRSEEDGLPFIWRSRVVNNTASIDGGGIFVGTASHSPPRPSHAAMSITNSLIADNRAEGGNGGGINQVAGYLEIVSSTIANNYALHHGGGLYGQENPAVLLHLDAWLYNTILWGNTADDGAGAGPQISVPGGWPFLWYCDVQGGADAIEDDPGEAVWGEGCITDDPVFVDANGGDDDPTTWSDNDYSLNPLDPAGPSPCINTGDSDSIIDYSIWDPGIPVGEMDLMKNPRIAGCDVDIGAYEVQLATLNPPAIPSGEAGYAKNRYISFDPANAGQFTALRVVLTDTLDSTFDDQVGWHWWVGPPETYCENAGTVQAPDCPTGVGGLPEIDFTGAQLQCQPHYMDWSTVGTVHVFDREIIPDSTYEVQAIGYGCKLGAEEDYSDPLEITTSKWGDVIGNCTVWPEPCTPPDGSAAIADVTAINDKFKNLPGNVIKSRADIDPNTPDVAINVTDVTYAIDAFLGFDYPFGPVEYPFDECPDPPPAEECEADIRVDSNNDGVIDFIDDFLEETQGVTVVFNADDDNENDIADWEETNVTGEDDLVEMQLSAPSCAPGMWTGWSLSWIDPEDVLEVWWYPNKSSGTALVNGYVYEEWPPWPSVWLEATDAVVGEEFEITFTIYALDGRKHLFPKSDPDKTDRAWVKGSCLFGRKYAHVTKAAEATGCYAWITSRDAGLCGQVSLLKPHVSCAWVGVSKWVGDEEVARKWFQIGYEHRRPMLSTVAVFQRYAETKAGPNASDYNMFVHPHTIDDGSYKCWLWSPLFSRVQFEWIGLPFHHFSHDGWRNETGTHYQYAAEIFHREDQMVGTLAEKCSFTNCQYSANWSAFDNTIIIDGLVPVGDLHTDDPDQWGIERVNATSFNVWDKIPNQ